MACNAANTFPWMPRISKPIQKTWFFTIGHVIDFQTKILGYIIGRNRRLRTLGAVYADSSLWPCQNHYLKPYCIYLLALSIAANGCMRIQIEVNRKTKVHWNFQLVLKRWSKRNGYRQVLAISLPLVASMGSITLMQFTDRVFLANYSVDAIAAAMPAGIASFTFIAFFMGVATYTNAFVAQVHRRRSLWAGRVGPLARDLVLHFFRLSTGLFVLHF